MRLRKNWLYLLLLVEFQSTDDPLMALRIHTYTGLLYQELARNGHLDATTTSPARTGTCTSPAAGRRVGCSTLAAVPTSSESCACRGRSYADSGDNAPLPSV